MLTLICDSSIDRSTCATDTGYLSIWARVHPLDTNPAPLLLMNIRPYDRVNSGHLPAVHVGRDHALVLAGASMGAFCVHLVGPSCVS